jgi:ABC-2 type transport system permease protein
MKKFCNWLNSSASDFVLFIIVLILANLVGSRAFVRFDLTGPKSYSLSPASIEVVKTLEEPLSVKVFFSSNLPAPYNSVNQYVHDILLEYKEKADNNFSYQFFDMDKQENVKLAQDYNLNQIQIQQVKNNEVGFKQGWMGIAITYADRIETLDGLTSSDGLEYKITTTISRMISTSNTLSGLSGKVQLTLYITDKLSAFNITGFDQIEKAVQAAYTSVNKKSMDRITYEKIDPAPADIPALVAKYGFQGLNWDDPKIGKGTGVFGLVLQYGDNFRLVPLQMTRSLFGGNAIAGLDTLEQSITESLQGLVAKSVDIGYVTGHSEAALNDSENGAGHFSALVGDLYQFKELNLATDDIPANLTNIVINGPKTAFTDTELYKIDQFVLKGGNLILFLDPFNEQLPQGQAAYFQQPSYTPIKTGLEKLLTKYGVKQGSNYVLDENCYQATPQGQGRVSIYYAPVLQRRQLDRKSPITKNLGYVIYLQSSSLDIGGAQADKNVAVSILARSSPQSWLMTNNIQLTPSFITPPADKTKEASENLAVLLEGKFESAYAAAPAAEAANTAVAAPSGVSVENHLAKSVLPGKIFISGSSLITGPQLIDENGSQPVALFVRNVIDYMNGNQELCTMRTKGLSLNTLTITSPAAAATAKIFNEFGLVLIIAIIGLFVWRARVARRNRIRMMYNPDDSREISTKKTTKDGKK